MSARAEILDRIRVALRDVPVAGQASGPGGHRPPPAAPAVGCLDALLQERLLDYRATAHRCSPEELVRTLSEALARRSVRRLALPPGLAALLLPAGIGSGLEVVLDDGTLTADALDGCDAVLTAAALAIASTGTVVLDGSPDQGRRAITLLPDYHLCIVDAATIVETVPEAMARLDPARPLTWISGPSATSDIELERVEGVHGPRTLDIVIVGSPAAPQADWRAP